MSKINLSKDDIIILKKLAHDIAASNDVFDDNVEVPHIAPSMTTQVEELKKSCSCIMGLNLPTQTMYLIIAVLMVAFAIWFFSKQ